MTSSPTVGNRLLTALPADEFAELARDLDAVRLRVRQVLYEPGDSIEHVYFPQSAVISLVSTMQSGVSAEIALVGQEGFVGLPAVLGGGRSSTQVIVQIEGAAFRMTATALMKARDRSARLRDLVDLYTQKRLVQTSQIAACNRLHYVEARLARWLGHQFRLTQEFIAQMLGTRRPTLTAAMLALQHDGLIEYHQSAITIVDRRGLEATACECYEVIRTAFDQPLRVAAKNVDDDRVDGPRKTAVEMLREIAGRLMIASIREQEAKEEAEAASQAKDRFLAALSHELRTALTAIVDWSRRLAGPHSAEDSRRGFDTIERTGHAQLKLIDDLLDISRIAAGTLPIHPTAVGLVDVVVAAMANVRPAADDKRIEFRATLDRAVEPVWGDPDRLQQLVQNVLSSAVTFTQEDGRIEVRLDRLGSKVRLAVSDTGDCAGDSRMDTALGLMIASQLVELHGGTFRIESAGERHGTTCTVDLPTTHHPPSGLTVLAAAGD